MQTKVEGLLISKMPYAERDLIGTLLLRNGKKINCIFHGGRGGGSKKKSSILELGFMLKVDLQRANRKGGREGEELHTAKEWSLLWHHDKIRLDHKAFYLLCFFLEVIRKMSIYDELHDEHRESDDNSCGLFKVLSNSLFYVEDQLKKENSFNSSLHLSLFLTKLLIELGVYPDREVCHLCYRPLESVSSMRIAFEQGGYICDTCLGEAGPPSGKALWDLTGQMATLSYKDYAKISGSHSTWARLLFDYLCFQFQISEKDFLSSSMVL
jgi:DNA repair protein RecO